MIDLQNIKGLIFDYGGTIDSNGLHWAEVIWMGYEAAGIPISKEVFRQAYIHGERTLGKNPIIRPHHTFGDMMRLKIEIQFEWLHTTAGVSLLPAKAEEIAGWCYRYAARCIDTARPVIAGLAGRYPLVLVSNFYGNIESVLKNFKLNSYFGSIIESAVVGIRKPDPAIFALGVEKLQVSPENVVVIGDSYDKDIVPATGLGCKTIWLKNIGWEAYKGSETADIIVEDFTELRQIFAV